MSPYTTASDYYTTWTTLYNATETATSWSTTSSSDVVTYYTQGTASGGMQWVRDYRTPNYAEAYHRYAREYDNSYMRAVYRPTANHWLWEEDLCRDPQPVTQWQVVTESNDPLPDWPDPAGAARWQQESQEKEVRRAAACQRALSLLRSVLNKIQYKSFEKHEYFRVRAPSGRRYQIECHRRQENVFLLDDKGRKIEQLCAYQPGTPLADTHVAQLLMLQTDEAKFRKIANIKRLIVPSQAA